MTKRTMISIGLLAALMAQPAMAATSCPNFSGKWLGTCEMKQKGSSVPAAVLSAQKLLKQQASLLEIVQLPAGHPVACKVLTVNGDAVSVGGLNSQQFSISLDDGTPIALAYSQGAAWKNEALHVKGSALLQVGGDQLIPFGVGTGMSLQADGTLKSATVAVGENFHVETNCTYQRQP